MKNQSLEILKVIVDTSGDGRYVIIDYIDFFEASDKITLNNEELKIIIKDLEINGYIELKFIKEGSMCGKPTKLGFGAIEGYNRNAFVETETLLTKEGQAKAKTIKKVSIFLVAFLGSLLGSSVILIVYLLINLLKNK